MTYIKLIWKAITSGEYNLYNVILNTVITGGVTGLTIMKFLRDANQYINEFGYSIVIICTIFALLLKYIELRHKIKKSKNES